MSLQETLAIVHGSLDQLQDQEADHVPHIAAVSLWRLHAAGRGIPQRTTYRILSRCLTALGLQTEVVPVVVRIWPSDGPGPMATYGRLHARDEHHGEDWYFVLAMPGIDRFVDAHIPELPAIAGSQLEHHFLQAPYPQLLDLAAIGVNRFDRVIEYRVADPGLQNICDPDCQGDDHIARRLVGEVLDVLRWNDAWRRLEPERWSTLLSLIHELGDDPLLVSKSDDYMVLRSNGELVDFVDLLEAASSPLASGK
jgi:hypothetical protein